MIVLGIDPGPTQSACVMWDGCRISRRDLVKNTDFVFGSGNFVVAVEHLQCFGMPVGREVFETAYFVGELRARSRIARLEFRPVMRMEVKSFWCNSARAKDSNIRQALIDRFGAPGTKKSPGLTYGLKGDLWSAFAIAAMVWDKGQ